MKAALKAFACLAALICGGCRTVGFLEPLPDNTQVIQARARERHIHGNNRSADRCAEIFASSQWHPDAPAQSRLRRGERESLVMVSTAPDPRFPDDLRRAGWIRSEFFDDAGESLRRMTLYDREWKVVAYLDADQQLFLAVGDEFQGCGSYEMADAARKVYGAETFFGIDNLRYEESTMLGLMSDWSSQPAQMRGAALQQTPRVAKVETADDAQTALMLHDLSRDVFYAREEKRQRALQRRRVGVPAEFDRRIGDPAVDDDAASDPAEEANEE